MCSSLLPGRLALKVSWVKKTIEFGPDKRCPLYNCIFLLVIINKPSETGQVKPWVSAHAAEKCQISFQDQSLIPCCCRPEVFPGNVAAELFHLPVYVNNQQQANIFYTHFVDCFVSTEVSCIKTYIMHLSCVPFVILAVRRTSWHNCTELFSAAWYLMCSVYVSMILTPLSQLFCSLSESFFMVKGAALFLQQGSSHQGQKAHPHHKHAGGNHKTQHSESPCCYPHHLPKLRSFNLASDLSSRLSRAFVW